MDHFPYIGCQVAWLQLVTMVTGWCIQFSSVTVMLKEWILCYLSIPYKVIVRRITRWILAYLLSAPLPLSLSSPTSVCVQCTWPKVSYLHTLQMSRAHKTRWLEEERVIPVEAHSPVKMIEIEHPGTCLATMAYVYVQLCSMCYYFYYDPIILTGFKFTELHTLTLAACFYTPLNLTNASLKINFYCTRHTTYRCTKR